MPGSGPGMTIVDAAALVNSGQHAHDVALLHDQEFLAIELDFGARPFAEQHAVADLEVDRDQLAGLVAAAGADRGDLTLRGLFLGAVRNDDAALGLLFGIDTLDHDTVMQRTKFALSHGISFWRVGFQVWVRSEMAPEQGWQPASLAIAFSECQSGARGYGVPPILSSKGLSHW